MKAGLAVFISFLLYASTTSAQGIAPNTAGVAKPPAAFNTPGTFQNPGTFQQFPKPAGPNALVPPVAPVTRAQSDADTIRARETQEMTKAYDSAAKQAKKEYEQSQEQFNRATRVIMDHQERVTQSLGSRRD